MEDKRSFAPYLKALLKRYPMAEVEKLEGYLYKVVLPKSLATEYVKKILLKSSKVYDVGNWLPDDSMGYSRYLLVAMSKPES